MDSAVKTLENVASEQCNKYVVVQRKDFQRIGDGLCDLAKALEIDERRAVTNICLSNSVAHAAGVYIKIGKMFEEQVKRDWQPFCDHMHIYRGILGSFPDILNEHRNVMGKKKECEKLTAEQKMGNAQLQEVNRRVDVFNYALMAEMSHFRAERDVHLKQTMRDLISEQIEFYARIIDKLQEAKKFFD
jgi:sorting nexin-9/18/33